MNEFRNRQIIIILLLVVFAGGVVSYSTTNTNKESKHILDAIPFTFQNWRGENLELTADVLNILQTESILVREYRNDKGDKVTLAVVYYPDNKLGFHQPESCLGGIGYTIVEDGIKNLNFSLSTNYSLQVKWLHYNRNQTHELIYYFYETNDYITPNYLSFRWQMLLNQLKYKQTNGALIRVSTPIQRNSPPEKILQEFLFKIFPFIENYIKFEDS